MRVKYYIPTTDEQGPCTIIGTSSAMETAEENALWDYNDRRAHDGQLPLEELPRGTTYLVLED